MICKEARAGMAGAYGWLVWQPRSLKGRRDNIATISLRVLRLQFFEVRHQLVLVGEAGEIEADHLVGAKRRLFAGP